MPNKYKIAHLVGTTRTNEKRFRDMEKTLTEQGYIVFAPVFYDLEKYLSFGKTPNMLDEMCSQKLEMCDFIVLATPERIGESTNMRIKQARERNKGVYILKDNKLVAYDEGKGQ